MSVDRPLQLKVTSRVIQNALEGFPDGARIQQDRNSPALIRGQAGYEALPVA